MSNKTQRRQETFKHPVHKPRKPLPTWRTDLEAFLKQFPDRVLDAPLELPGRYTDELTFGRGIPIPTAEKMREMSEHLKSLKVLKLDALKDVEEEE